MKKSKVLIIVLVLLLALSGAAHAEDNTIVTPQSSDIFMAYGAGISHASGYIRCHTFSDLNQYANQSITMRLQKYENNTWVTLATWNDSTYHMIFDLRRNYPASPGTYQVRGTHYAGGETKVSTSGSFVIN